MAKRQSSAARLQMIKEALRIAARAPAGADTAEAVVAAAKNPRSVLHRAFDWNDAREAHRHRLIIAREILREAHEIVVHRRRQVQVVTLISNPRVPRNYVLTSAVAKNAELKRLSIGMELRQLGGDLERLVGLLVRYELPAAADRVEQMQALLDEIMQIAGIDQRDAAE
jgi:hypothetical protein